MSAEPEWYVGISGDPVGPVDHAFIKKQIDDGKVTGASLVWREDLTDWKPLSTFSELARMLPSVPADVASNPIALTRAKEEEARASQAAATRAQADAKALEDERKREIAEAKAREEAAREAEAERAREIAEAKARAETEKAAEEQRKADFAATMAMPEDPLGLADAARPSSPVEDAGEASADDAFAPMALGALGPEGLAPEPLAPPSAPESARESVPPDSEELRAAGIPPGAERRRRERGINPLAYALIAMATAFGGVAAWFIFGQKAQPAQIAQGGPQVLDSAGNPVPRAPGSVSEAVAKGGDPQPGGSAITVEGVDVPSGNTGNWPGSKTNGNGETDPDPEPGNDTTEPKPSVPTCTDPDDPFCNNGPAGPTKDTGPGNGGESGSPLSPAQVSSTVSKFRGSLMRRCRSMVTKGNAKVSATIRVAPSGAVSSVSASGGDGVPGLSSCVQSRIANWRFPTAGASTTVNVSFNFLSG